MSHSLHRSFLRLQCFASFPDRTYDSDDVALLFSVAVAAAVTVGPTWNANAFTRHRPVQLHGADT